MTRSPGTESTLTLPFLGTPIVSFTKSYQSFLPHASCISDFFLLSASIPGHHLASDSCICSLAGLSIDTSLYRLSSHIHLLFIQQKNIYWAPTKCQVMYWIQDVPVSKTNMVQLQLSGNYSAWGWVWLWRRYKLLGYASGSPTPGEKKC